MSQAKLTLTEFADLWRRLIGEGDAPIVVHAGVWTLYSAFDIPPAQLPTQLVETMLAATPPHRTLFMPAFTSGFRDGFLDLDSAPGSTGEIGEALRRLPQAKRSASAFFSFCGIGPEAEEVQNLRPTQAWGDDSFYAWMEKRDALVVLLGVAKTSLAYFHRLEWLCRHQLPYRYEKTFHGRVQLDGKEVPLTETLLVRDERFGVENSLQGYEKYLEDAGMQVMGIGRGAMSALSTWGFRRTLLPFIEKDPFAFVRERDKMRGLYQGQAQPQPQELGNESARS